MSQIQITLPNSPKDTIDSVLFLLKSDLQIKNMLLLAGDNNSIIIFRASKRSLPTIMRELSRIGVGIDFGIIDIVPLNATIPDVATEFDQTKITAEDELRSRISLEEIKKYIGDVSNLGMNYVIFLLLASLIAGAGLLKNSTVILIASMLLSPLMGPILSVSYGIVVKDRKIVYRGIKGQLIGIGIGLVAGLIMGLITLIFDPGYAITAEMQLRSFPTILDVIVAICGGLAIGFCITDSIQSALVGIAIAVSLLPPVVNTAILVIFGEWYLALGSFTLTLTNVGIINICAIGVFKLKRIESLPLTAYDWKGPEEQIVIDAEPPEITSFSGRLKKIFKKKTPAKQFVLK